MTKCVQPDRSNEIDLQPLLETLQTQLNEHAERLEKHLQARLYRIIHKFEDELHARETQKIIEEHAAAERAIQNNGWIDFDPEETSGLIDDETYLVRYKGRSRQWMCPHLAYWDAEEGQFRLLHSSFYMSPIVHQYFKVPE